MLHLKRPTPMTRQLIYSIIILTICLVSCGQKKTETKKYENATSTNRVDTSIFVVLPFDTSQIGKPTHLTADDLLKIETILKRCIIDYNPEQEKRFQEINDKHPEYKLDKRHFIIDLTRYKRQYMPTINSKGEKEVWVNCFCGQWDKSSRTNPVIVMDGGNCFFNLKINLTTGQYYELIVNGEA